VRGQSATPVARLIFAAEDQKGGAVLHGPRFFEQSTVTTADGWRAVTRRSG